VPLSMCRWKSSADDARRRLMTPSQAKSPSAPEAIEDQLRSGGSLRPLSLLWGILRTASRLRTALSTHQPVDDRVPHLERSEYSPEPPWSADLGIGSLTQVPQCDRRHDDVENHQGYENRSAWLPTFHGVIVPPHTVRPSRRSGAPTSPRASPEPEPGQGHGWPRY
jgi:hypothetical protein